MSETIRIEVVYALPYQQAIQPLQLPLGATAEQAIKQSGILDKFPGIDLEKNKIGIFGKSSKLDAVLRDKDRVEIYRPLLADPKEIRRRRAEEGKDKKSGEADATNGVV
jgi:uncharacterized protein